jgi:hypothetical protein
LPCGDEALISLRFLGCRAVEALNKPKIALMKSLLYWMALTFSSMGLLAAEADDDF